MKLLYANSRYSGAHLRFDRIYTALQDQHTIRVAGYANNSDYPLDWTLDALYGPLGSNRIHYDTALFTAYCQQVEAFAPDLIISDLEPFTSHLAKELNIEIWQMSPSLMTHGVREGPTSGLRSRYGSIVNGGEYSASNSKWFQDALHNASRKLIYSHFGDLINPPALNSGFEWLRPYHLIGEQSPPCQHQIAAVSLENNKHLLAFLKQYQDVVVFSKTPQERYTDLILKDANNLIEYACNLRNCQTFVSEGYSTHLADAFYNGQHAYIYPNLRDRESIIHFTVSEQLKTGTVIYNWDTQLQAKPPPAMTYRSNISFLDELI
jgi:hypothetical protein